MQAAEYELMFRIEETHWWYRALHRIVLLELERAVPHWREKAVLDAGCGTGAILKKLGNPTLNRGVDLSPEALNFCRQRGLDNVIGADIANMPFESGSFDAVICSSVLYHRWVPDVGKALRELNRVLAPGGALLLNVPAYDFLYSAHDDAVFTARRFTKKLLTPLLKGSGFVPARTSYWTTLPFPAALLARTLHPAPKGRDFGDTGAFSKTVNCAMNGIMRLEFELFRRVSLPFGVALFCVAKKAE